LPQVLFAEYFSRLSPLFQSFFQISRAIARDKLILLYRIVQRSHLRELIIRSDEKAEYIGHRQSADSLSLTFVSAIRKAADSLKGGRN
jgi:hypothetical protein